MIFFCPENQGSFHLDPSLRKAKKTRISTYVPIKDTGAVLTSFNNAYRPFEDVAEPGGPAQRVPDQACKGRRGEEMQDIGQRA